MNETKYIVRKSTIEGIVNIDGAKNSALKLLAATILTDKACYIKNFPSSMIDIKIHVEMLEKLGKKVKHLSHNEILITEKVVESELIWEKQSIRNTLLILGCLLAKNGIGKVPLPGGCKLGDRKFDIHIDLMREMGADVWEEGSYIVAKLKKGRKLKGVEYTLPIRSTGATENGILMGVLAEGETRIWNPHIRPEIIDLIHFLTKMGANIQVRGQESIIIKGGELKYEVSHSVVSDNMEALTYLIAGAVAGNVVEIVNFPFEHLETPLIFLRESGLKFYRGDNSLIVKKSFPYPVEIATGPYPGINSDMQPLFAVYGLMANGKSSITDLRFVGRYGYSKEFEKMGGTFEEENNVLRIVGGKQLKGATVNAIDLRSGAALLVAGLCAEGETIIENAWMIERGYNNVIEKVKKMKGNLNIY